MNTLEQITEGLSAVRDEIDAILRTGPVITREEAWRVGVLMRLTGQRALRLHGELPEMKGGDVRSGDLFEGMQNTR
jgi:hypothetical protein